MPVYLLGTLDTKGTEIVYVQNCCKIWAWLSVSWIRIAW